MTIFRPLLMAPKTGTFTYATSEARELVSAITTVNGVQFKGDLKVTQRAGAGLPMSVDVAPGAFSVNGMSLANQNTFWGASDQVQNVTVATAPGSGTRTDLIVAQLYDDQADNSGLSSWVARYIQNPSVNTGAPPALDTAAPTALPLAWVTVAAGTSSITNAMIKDVRTLNLTGDLPGWSYEGGSQTIPTATNQAYTIGTLIDATGVDTNPSFPGEITVRQGGVYGTGYLWRFNNTGTDNTLKSGWVDYLDASRAFKRRLATQNYNGARPTEGVALTGFSVHRFAAGEVTRGMMRQESGSTINLYDGNNELTWFGFWIRP